jgi:hypothetical protein
MLVDMMMRFVLTYDSDKTLTSVFVVDKTKIAMRYLKSEFIWDLIAIFPF